MAMISNIIHDTKIEELTKDDWQEIVSDMIRDGGSYNAE
jgi:hypothetical protein